MSRDSLVGIKEACRVLGVSETALRTWTDEGKIKAFITPGGHRRYTITDLDKFMINRPKSFGIADLVMELEDTGLSFREIARTSLAAKTWYSKLDNESQQHLAGLGRSMLQVIIKFAAEPAKREKTMQTAREIGHEFGEMLAAQGLALNEAVEAFVLHHRPIMNTVTHLLKKRESLTGRVAEAVPPTAYVLDEALISLVAAHQQYISSIQNDQKLRL
jgi:excisionase family DNA binding protein